MTDEPASRDARSAPLTGDASDGLAGVEAALTAVLARLDAEHERAAARERVIDHLHARVERLRAARRAQALLPVVTDLRLLRDDLLNQAQTLTDGLTRDQMAALLASFAGVVELSLERCGVTVLPVTAGRHHPRPTPGGHGRTNHRPGSRR